MSVCLSCPVPALTFESLDLETSFLACRYIFRISRSSLYVKVNVTEEKITRVVKEGLIFGLLGWMIQCKAQMCSNPLFRPLKVCYKVSLSKNFQRQSCSTINYLSKGINILAGDDPVTIKFGPEGTSPQQEGCTFHILHAVHLSLC